MRDYRGPQVGFPRPQPRRIARDGAGFTLIEMLVAMAMGLVVLTAVLTLMNSVTVDSDNDIARNDALTQDTSGVANMVQLLDQAYHVNGPSSTTTSSNWIDVEVRIPGQGPTRVLFNCGVADANPSYNDCVRYESAGMCGTGCVPGTAPSGASKVIVVPRVLNNPVFTNLSTPSAAVGEITFGDVTVDTPSSGDLTTSYYKHQVVINNAFYIRQLDFGR